jgi:hypothetical protein
VLERRQDVCPTDLMFIYVYLLTNVESIIIGVFERHDANRVDDVLTIEELDEISHRLKQAEFVDGKLTAGIYAKTVKHNQQIQSNTDVAENIQTIAHQALKRNALASGHNGYKGSSLCSGHLDSKLGAAIRGARNIIRPGYGASIAL